MKTITVRYFAMFREHAGVSAETLTLDVGTAADVFERTKARHGSAEPPGDCKGAINDEMVAWSTVVSDGGTVLLFRPVACGGHAR